jgi:hypothetical protein
MNFQTRGLGDLETWRVIFIKIGALFCTYSIP